MSTVLKRGRTFVRASARHAAKRGESGTSFSSTVASGAAAGLDNSQALDRDGFSKPQKKARHIEPGSLPDQVQQALDNLRSKRKDMRRGATKKTSGGQPRRARCFIDPPKVSRMQQQAKPAQMYVCCCFAGFALGLKPVVESKISRHARANSDALIILQNHQFLGFESSAMYPATKRFLQLCLALGATSWRFLVSACMEASDLLLRPSCLLTAHTGTN